MALRSILTSISSRALAVGLAASTAFCGAATSPALAQQSQAVPPKVIVYVTPEWHLQDVYSPIEAARGSSASAQPIADEPSVRTVAHQAEIAGSRSYAASGRHANDSASPSVGSSNADSAAASSVYRTAMAEDMPTTHESADQSPAAPQEPAAGAPDYAADCGCEPCGGYCGPRLRCISGMEFTFVKPEIDEGTVSMNLADSAGIGRNQTLNIESFETEQLEIAPRFWLGVQGECWGVVSRYWRLDDAANDHSLYYGGADLGYDFASELDMYTIDLEVTRNFHYSTAQGMATFGVRQAHAERNASLDVLSDTSSTEYISMARFGQAFDGTGLTGSISAAQPIWCGSCIRWYYLVRGSILWGDTDTYADTAVMAATGAFAQNAATVSIEDEAFIGEAQLGLRWDHRLECSPATVFLKTGFEYQHWSAQGGPTIAQSFAGVGTSLVTTTAAAEEVDLNLFGFAIATGLNW